MKRASILLTLLTQSVFAQTVTIPANSATVAGDATLNYSLSTSASTAQYGYSETILKAAGLLPGDVLTGLRFRLPLNGIAGPDTPSAFANWDLTISKSTRPVGSLTAFIPGNQASDAVAVRRGSLV